MDDIRGLEQEAVPSDKAAQQDEVKRVFLVLVLE
jgi:hypothetical protein